MPVPPVSASVKDREDEREREGRRGGRKRRAGAGGLLPSPPRPALAALRPDPHPLRLDPDGSGEQDEPFLLFNTLGSNASFILTGCYDGLARIWKDAAVCTQVLEGHSGAITSASFINKGVETDDGSLHVVTGSKDWSLRLFKFDTSVTMGSPKRIGAYKILPGHTSSVQSIAVDPSRNMICSASWDTTIKLWAVEGSGEDGDAVSVKKRRMNSDASGPEESQIEGSASSTLLGHTQCVSSVAWPEQ